MVMVRDLNLGGEHTKEYADDVLESYTLETCMVFLTNATLISTIKKYNGKQGPWMSGLVGWNVIWCTKKLQVQFCVRAHSQVARSPVGASSGGN